MGTCAAHSPLLGNIRVLRTSDTTREFHSKVVINEDMTIYVSIHSMLNIALRNQECEGFSITQFLYIS